ncbi:hypothetical protein [uncultured Aquimarina sp.]|uniref:hypothetical protein n=1 Tax=uncultured Aquimarina sp. TaxID=575652 RepID=UPI00260AF139|nr:hypothetical protein [uncultured Aquimarina sp.]
MFVFIFRYFGFMELPGLNNRILKIIEEETFGKVKPFAELIGFSQPQKLNRLFKPDSRNGEYPIPSTDILLAIVERFSDINLEWLLLGEGNQRKSGTVRTSSDNQDTPTEGDIMKVIEMIYLHEDVLKNNKMFLNWLNEKENQVENRLLKKLKAMEKIKDK